MRAYLDWNATAPLAAPARAAMLEAAELGNPSSVHAEGRRARQVLDRARGQVAALCGSRPDRVLFTSGASEAAATLLTPLWRLGRGTLHFSRLLVTATDHPCVLSGGRFAPGLVNRLPVDGDGRLDLEALDAALAGAGAPLVATHLANNETGVIQDAEVIAARVHAAGGVLIVDAAQAPGRLALDLPSLGADALFLSSHKIGGPMGAGAIVLAGDLVAPAPLIAGGGQERGLRGGTENVMAIAGFGAAAELAVGADSGRLMALRRRFEAMIIARAPDAVIHAAAAPRLPNTVYFTLPGRRAETLQIAFDLAGVAVSAGSACSSGKVGRSHVLEAMGADAATGAIRLSFGTTTGEAELTAFAEALDAVLSGAAMPAARKDGSHSAHETLDNGPGPG